MEDQRFDGQLVIFCKLVELEIIRAQLQINYSCSNALSVVMPVTDAAVNKEVPDISTTIDIDFV